MDGGRYPFFGTLLIWGVLLAASMCAGVESAYVCAVAVASPLVLRAVAAAAAAASAVSAPAFGAAPLHRLSLVVAGLFLPTLLMTQ